MRTLGQITPLGNMLSAVGDRAKYRLTSESDSLEDWEAMWEGGEGAARRLLLAPEALLNGDGRMRLTLPCTNRIGVVHDDLLVQSETSNLYALPLRCMLVHSRQKAADCPKPDSQPSVQYTNLGWG